MVGKVLTGSGITVYEGDASAGPRYRDNGWSRALPALHVVNDLLTFPLADGEPSLDANEVLGA